MLWAFPRAGVYLHPFHGRDLFYVDTKGHIQESYNLRKLPLYQNKSPPEDRIRQFNDGIELDIDLDGRFPSPSLILWRFDSMNIGVFQRSSAGSLSFEAYKKDWKQLLIFSRRNIFETAPHGRFAGIDRSRPRFTDTKDPYVVAQGPNGSLGLTLIECAPKPLNPQELFKQDKVKEMSFLELAT